MTFKDDIIQRIQSDFGPSANEAIHMLETAITKVAELKPDRIIRCIIFLSKGNTTELRKVIQMASADPRDVMFAAEYTEEDGPHQYKRTRDFSETFDNSELAS